jgi:uncharacterized membrane protein YfcA
MPETATLLLAAGMLIGAMLYSSVGHAGASAYIALMALAGLAPEEMRPTALVLNVLVASFTSVRYIRAGQFRWRTLWPFLLGAVPLAFVGGGITLPTTLYRPIVGLVLWASAARLLYPKPLGGGREVCDPPVPIGVLAGAGIGLLAGLTGTGGGIFLSPLLLFAGWSATKKASGVAIVFILANSLAGLAGNLGSLGALPDDLPLYAGAVMVGALVGTRIGIRVRPDILLKLLALVLLIAGAKLLSLW